MRIAFTIDGSFLVPDGTRLLPGTTNLFQLPTGQIVSVHPVIEMASSADADDHHDLTSAAGFAIGVDLLLYDRRSAVEADGDGGPARVHGSEPVPRTRPHPARRRHRATGNAAFARSRP